MKFGGMLGCNAGTIRLDLGSNADREPDPGIFKRNFIIVVGYGDGKDSSLWVRQQSENMQASGLRVEQIKSCHGG